MREYQLIKSLKVLFCAQLCFNKMCELLSVEYLIVLLLLQLSLFIVSVGSCIAFAGKLRIVVS